jgi:hypothetical protein
VRSSHIFTTVAVMPAQPDVGIIIPSRPKSLPGARLLDARQDASARSTFVP